MRRAAARLRPWFCGLPCGEMRLPAARGGAGRAEGGCPVCREEVGSFREEEAGPRRGGAPVSLEEAIAAAARILLTARAPFVYGLARSATETARRAAALAAALGGGIDVEAPPGARAERIALQTFGLPGATFGEIRNRADLVLLWRCDPRVTHPHLLAGAPRTPLQPPGTRRVILLPPAAEPPSRARADLLLAAIPGSDLEVALALRAMAAGRRPAGETIGGVPAAAVRQAADLLRAARYAAILWDTAATGGPDGPAVASALTLLARDLNAAGRCAARPLGGGGNVAGAAAAILGATGSPGAVGFGSGRPRFAPGEYDAGRILGEALCDALLLVGARGPLPATLSRRPGGAPRIVALGPRLPAGAAEPDVFIPTGLPGLSEEGEAMRADGVPVRLRATLLTQRPAEREVLAALEQAVAAGRGSAVA